ncbi:MAG: hypothetical protein JW959_04765 [Pirellulales bacterium]|nr:hypothetical protein [Pirellulales bacterium]
MKPRRSLCLLIMAGMSLLLSSCESDNPLSDPQKANLDKRLLGIWRLDDSGETVYYHVGKASDKLPPGVMMAVQVRHALNGSIQRPGEFFAFSTSIGEYNYLNLIGLKDEDGGVAKLWDDGWKPELISDYLLVKYEVKGDSLDIWVMEADAQRLLIESGKIKGVIDGDGTRFTDTTEKLAALMASPEGEKLFPKEPTEHYKRVK